MLHLLAGSLYTLASVVSLVGSTSSGAGHPRSSVPALEGRGYDWAFVDSPALVDSSLTTGCTWGDYDGDGDDDIFFANGNEGGGSPWDQLIRNDGGGAFSIQEAGALAGPGSERCGVWGDYDNDDDLDLLVSGPTSEKVYRNDGSQQFVDVSGPIFTNTSDTFSPAWVDIDNDGDLDISLGHVHRTPQFLRNDGKRGFVDATPPIIPSTVPGLVYAAVWSDIDQDRDQDVYFVRNSQPSSMFRNDGEFQFADITFAPVDIVGNGHGAAWGDVDRDGRFDLYVTNLGGGNRLFLNLGNGEFADASYGQPAESGYSAGCAWGDYDNDGLLDLFFTNAYSLNSLLHNDGNLKFTNVSEGVLTMIGVGGGTSFCDFDQDGDLDLLLADLDENHSNRLFRNDRPLANEFLEVSLVGTVSNRNGIGARIGVWANGLEQWREISGGTGFSSQDPLRAHFGFGLASLRGRGVVDSVRVHWPLGRVQVVRNVAVNQRITIVEPRASLAVSEFPEPMTFKASEPVETMSIQPNPIRDLATIDLQLPTPGSARLSVFDVRGRRVRVWDQPSLPAGQTSVVWNRANQNGSRLPAGVYIVQLESAGLMHSRKVVLFD